MLLTNHRALECLRLKQLRAILIALPPFSSEDFRKLKSIEIKLYTQKLQSFEYIFSPIFRHSEDSQKYV